MKNFIQSILKFIRALVKVIVGHVFNVTRWLTQVYEHLCKRSIDNIFHSPESPPSLPSIATGQIINPRGAPSQQQIVTPTEYKFTPEERLSVVKTHEYINIRPTRSYSAKGGAK